MDLYSLRASMGAVIEYLDRVDPAASERAKERYGCFDHFGQDMESYALAVGAGLNMSCEDQVVAELVELLQRRGELVHRDGPVAADEYFYAEQNARIARNAERYYRTMIGAGISSWNLRDTHMAETLEHLVTYFSRHNPGVKAVVWAHNSHVGDAAGTDMSRRGETNIGELVRRRYKEKTRLIGLTTYAGTVTAATDWHGPAERKRVRPALADSIESIFHHAGIARFYLDLHQVRQSIPELRESRLQRFIGVVYRPESERQSHYYHTRIADQYDAVIHFGHTGAVEPLERTPHWDLPEVPETFPTGV